MINNDTCEFLLFICRSLQLQNYLCSKNYVQNPRFSLQIYEITLHVTDLFTRTIVARRKSRSVCKNNQSGICIHVWFTLIICQCIHSNIEVKRGLITLITIQANPPMSSIPNFMFCAVAIVCSFSAAARTTAAASGHRKSTLIELQEQKISEILQQTASVITEKRL